MNDLKFAFRQLLKNPGFTPVAVLTLALGIGANTAIFSVVNGVLLRPLPFRDPDRLVRIWESQGERNGNVTAPDFLDWQRRQRVFESLGAFTSVTLNLTGADQPERLVARRV